MGTGTGGQGTTEGTDGLVRVLTPLAAAAAAVASGCDADSAPKMFFPPRMQRGGCGHRG